MSAAKSELLNPSTTPQPSSGPPLVTTDALFTTGPEVLIVHGPDTYRLRITRTGKLILTK